MIVILNYYNIDLYLIQCQTNTLFHQNATYISVTSRVSKKNNQSGHSYHIQITDQYVQNTGNIPDILLIHWLTSRVFSLLV